MGSSPASLAAYARAAGNTLAFAQVALILTDQVSIYAYIGYATSLCTGE